MRRIELDKPLSVPRKESEQVAVSSLESRFYEGRINKGKPSQVNSATKKSTQSRSWKTRSASAFFPSAGKPR